jgi:tetratricopeptide (TPR) repeat protein
MERWPHFAPAFHLRGFLALEAGDVATAERLIRAALDLDPSDAAASHSLGLALRAQRRLPEAMRAFEQALAREPRAVASMNSLALCLLDSNRLSEAPELLLTAARTAPSHAETHHHLGLVQERQGRPGEAQASFQRAMGLNPALLPPIHACAKSFLESGRAEEAQALFRECLRRRPEWKEAKAGLALALDLLGRADEGERVLGAEAELDDMLAINLGNLVARGRRLDEALAIFDRVVARSPGNAVAHHNRANVLARMDRHAEAEAGFRRAMALQPRYADPRFGLSLLLLGHGHFENGWEESSWRPPGMPEWSSLGGLSRAADPSAVSRIADERTLEVVEEQGLGDMLFFLRWAAHLAQQGFDIVLRCGPRLGALAGRTGLFRIREELRAQQGVECAAIPAGDLPLLAHRLGRSQVPPSLAIAPLADCIERARTALAQAGPGPYLGVTWRAGVRHRALGRDNLTKEIDPTLLLDRLAWPGTVIALQRDATAEELSRLRVHRVADFSSWGDDLEQLLGLLATLDDYAGVSNTNVHLLGSAGRRARIVVPAPAEWRWSAVGAPTWFPGFSVIRQRYGQPWDEALPAPGEWRYPGDG